MNTFVLDIRTATPHFPGIGRYVAGLVPALAAQMTDGERLVLLCNNASQEAGFSHVLKSNAAVATCRVRATPFSLSQQWQVVRTLRQVSKNHGKLVYHSPYYLMPYWPGVPTVLTVHDLIPILLPETVSLRARLFFRLAHHLALRSADRIIAVSAATKRDLTNVFGIEETHIIVIPHGVDSRFNPQSQAETKRVRALYGLPEFFILYLGINKPHKNLVNLIHAYAMLSATAPSLVIAGAWDDRYPEAKDLVIELGLTGSVHFLGPVNDADLPGLYSAAMVFAFPSRYEGFGFPVLEAMACGTPVACSDVSSLPEVTGGVAFYFDPEAPAQIAQTIQQLLDGLALRLELSNRGLTQVASYSWERTAVETISTYRELTTQRSALSEGNY